MLILIHPESFRQLSLKVKFLQENNYISHTSGHNFFLYYIMLFRAYAYGQFGGTYFAITSQPINLS